MSKPVQIRGMLLEEAVLYLLRTTGYRAVEDVGNDLTLRRGNAGLNVRGRGTDHQIDAIADFLVQQPFCNPQRLLLEAKCFDEGKRVGLPVIRNAFGTLADVSEFWTTGADTPEALEDGPRRIPKSRFHYQYAVFSATGYSPQAEAYAFAQDVYLIPLAKSRFIQPVIEAIRNVLRVWIDRGGANIAVDLAQLRHVVRHALRGPAVVDLVLPQAVGESLDEFYQACHRINESLLATLGGRFPVFLIPGEGVSLARLPQHLQVTITWDEDGWYINGSYPGRDQSRLFSFDLPEELFELYARDGRLTQRAALDLKEAVFSSFQAVRSVLGELQIVQFSLQEGWIEQIRRRAE